jgi:hypothetical protein
VQIEKDGFAQRCKALDFALLAPGDEGGDFEGLFGDFFDQGERFLRPR